MTQAAVLLFACVDRPGIVSSISTHIFGLGGNILRSEQSESTADRFFYLRMHFDMQGQAFDVDQFRDGFSPIAEGLDAQWSVRDADTDQRTAILVSNQSHCLLDLLSRWRVGDLPAEIVGVISNHQNNRDIAEGFGVPFHHLPIIPETKREQEERLNRLLHDLDTEVVVLARYMQILSEEFIDRWSGKVINIHHSFLPAFPGAKPYHQAMERGVKLIGATAHYATAELDDGPIIEQDVMRTSHRDSVIDLIRQGREVESRVLAAALLAHLENRIIVAGRRTIVFE